MEVKQCVKCGSAFPILRKYGIEKRFCSDRCREMDEKKRWRDKNKEQILLKNIRHNELRKKETLYKRVHKIESESKRCNKCLYTKNKNEFHRQRFALDGRKSICKSCISEYSKSDKVKAQNRKRYYKDHEKSKAECRKRYKPKPKRVCIDCCEPQVKSGQRCSACFKKYLSKRKSNYDRHYAIEYRKRITNELKDGYVKSLLRNQTGIKSDGIQNSDIEIKRATVKLKRLINEKQRTIKSQRSNGGDINVFSGVDPNRNFPS
jgi:predicted nucleic acid-binding Zn ribbon protein